jgi:hypothetical protein
LARQRALAHAQAALPGVQLGGSRDVFEVRFLAPRGHLISDIREPGEKQDAVVCHFALVWREPGSRAASFHSSWLAEFPDHAAARFIQNARGADLSAALFEAAGGFAGADAAAVFERHQNFYLKAGPGVFAASLVLGQLESGVQVVYARPRTWLQNSLLDDQRVPLPPAAAPEKSIAALLLRMARNSNLTDGVLHPPDGQTVLDAAPNLRRGEAQGIEAGRDRFG